MRSDKRAIEKIAREDLGLVKKGEIVYEFVPSRNDSGFLSPCYSMQHPSNFPQNLSLLDRMPLRE